MLLPEITKKLCELQIKLRNNGSAKIHDITMLQDGEYGYVLALTSFKGDIYDEVLSSKLIELKGKKILPDLWLFGPCMKEGNSEQRADDAPEKPKEEKKHDGDLPQAGKVLT